MNKDIALRLNCLLGSWLVLSSHTMNKQWPKSMDCGPCKCSGVQKQEKIRGGGHVLQIGRLSLKAVNKKT